jgi:predicted permease
MEKKFKNILVIFFSVVFSLILVSPVFAQLQELQKTGWEAGYAVTNNPPETFLATTAGKIIAIALGFLGIILVILFIYGGFLWMTAGGNEEQIKKAKNILKNATIGLIITATAYAISYFVVDQLIKVLTATSPPPTT